MPRLRTAAAALVFAGAFALAAPTHASGDYGPSPSFRLTHRDLTGADDMVLLGPGNDTRTNLAMLLADRRGVALVPGDAKVTPLGALFDWRGFSAWLAPQGPITSTEFVSGEGSRCISNYGGSADFVGAVKAAKLGADESAALIAARSALQPDCAKPSAAVAPGGAIRSPTGRDFAAYLGGAQAFYDGDFDAASARFAALRDARSGWVREAARYMVGRVELNRAQVNLFDEYGSMQGADKVDQKAVSAADAGLRAYLKDYPAGEYADSARGLLRRVYWIGGRRDQLAAQYVGLFALAPEKRGIDDVDLAEEMDTKLLPALTPGDTKDPILLAVLDLRAMRVATDPDAPKTNPLAAAELERQRGAFAGNMPLFDFLSAARAFYLDGKPGEVLRLIPDAAKQTGFTSLQFSRQMLRGMALETMKDRNARGFWLDVIGSTRSAAQHTAVELALALHDERSGAVGKVFAPDSPIRDRTIRGLLLTNVADAALLRAQAGGATAPTERELALFTLLYKELSRGAYRAWLSDVALVPAGASTDAPLYDLLDAEKLPLGLFSKPTTLGDFGCPALRKTVSDLAATPASPHAQLCLADYFRASGFDDFALDTQPAKDQLGGTPTLFAGPVYSRLDVYKRIVADPAAASDDKAYALYRAVMCYAPSGNNTCGGKEVDKAQRKAWFQRLKRDYPKSSWADDLHYYW